VWEMGVKNFVPLPAGPGPLRGKAGLTFADSDLHRPSTVMDPIKLVRSLALILLAALVAIACGATARLGVSEGLGPNPSLPEPESSLIPTVKVATAIGWAEGTTPIAATGTRVTAFARGLDHPRWVYVLPNGDVLIAETNAPPRPEPAIGGVKGWFFKRYQKKAGGAVPSANRITLLRDTDGDGVADMRSVFASNLTSPFGMALVDDTLYVANTDAIVRLPYTRGATEAAGPAVHVTDLPGGPMNHHWTKNIVASTDGAKLYAAVGSNSNVAENGMEKEEGRAAVWEIDLRTGAKRIYASGLRNPVGMAWVPDTGALWVAVNERDELGSDLVPDYMTTIRDGAFYGWPYSYFGNNVDERVKPPRADLVAKAVAPDYALGPHTASLGLAYAGGASLPDPFRQGMFVGQHGSWNRQPRSGYKVIFVPFANGTPSGMPVDVLTGFVNDDGDARGRPVGVAIDTTGALLVADDVGNVVWRVTRDDDEDR
jgi:glucose/arabinose dehydrogenase